MSQRLNNLNDLISIVSGGRDFYRKAARQTDRPDAEAIYRENADLRDRIALELSRVVDDAGTNRPGPGRRAGPVDPDALRHALRRQGGGALLGPRASRGADDRRLPHVMHHRDNSADEEMLGGYLSEIEKSHARLRSLGASA
jgi:hypothetical protein